MAQSAATGASSQTADTCLSAPKGIAPAGSHWFYHVERGTKKQCWYLGEAKTKTTTKTKTKTARTATTQQRPAAAAADTAATDATPPQTPPAPAPAMRQSAADAHAEWPPSPASTSPVASAGAGASQAGDPSPPTAPAAANALSSDVNARWLDASSMAGTNGTRHAANQLTAAAPANATPPQAVAPASAAATEASAEQSSPSTQMLLIAMVSALALAGLVSAVVLRLPRKRSLTYQVHNERRAPWDSIHTEPALPTSVRHNSPLRLSQAPPRRVEMPVSPRETAGDDPDQTAQDNQQITAMLQRLARSAAS